MVSPGDDGARNVGGSTRQPGWRFRPFGGRAYGTDEEPAALWLVRHGQSEGRIRAAAAPDAEVLDIADRYMDVALSGLGERQAAAFGEWLRASRRRSGPTSW